MDNIDDLLGLLKKRVEIIPTSKGDYAIYEEGDRVAHTYIRTVWSIYLFLCEKKLDITDMTKGFPGISCIIYNGTAFEYYNHLSSAESIMELDKAIDKLEWVAFDLIHFYIELVFQDIKNFLLLC